MPDGLWPCRETILFSHVKCGLQMLQSFESINTCGWVLIENIEVPVNVNNRHSMLLRSRDLASNSLSVSSMGRENNKSTQDGKLVVQSF